LILGLDPDPARLWPRAVELAVEPGRAAGGRRVPADAGATVAAGATDPAASQAARAVEAHCALVIDAVGEQCVGVKLQVACFERLGAAGWAALSRVAAGARDRGLLVIADAKRGDIDISAKAYAQAFFGATPTPFGPVHGLDADALTVNPLLGADSLEPLVHAARQRGGGVFVLVRTSNPGAGDVQELTLADGRTISERLAEIVAELGAVGASGLADVGAVVGATAPHRIARLRERMPHASFLIPGVGAQGGAIEDLAPAFAPGPAGGLVAVSRGIVSAYERLGGDPAAAAAEEALRLRERAWSLVT
jgi:orotidine-5'-phosphate decarboxylase